MADGVKISGSATPSLSISNVLAVDAGSYTVIVTNGAGSVTSAPAVLTVIDPAVNTQPVSRTNIAFRIVSEWEATAIGNTNSNYVATVTAYVPTGTSSGTMRYDLVSVFGNVFGLPPLAPTTISNIIGTTLTYGGGAGLQFVLLKSTSPAAPLGGWTRAHTNFATPGTFTVPAGSENAAFYRIKSE